MANDEKPDFTIVDKRRATAEDEATAGEPDAAPTPADAAAEAGAPEPDAAPEQADEEAEEELPLPALSMRDRMLMCIDILGQGAWIAMGLVTDPVTGELNRNLAAARDAIDCVALLAEKVDPTLDDSVRRQVRNVVSDLRVNYVQQSAK